MMLPKSLELTTRICNATRAEKKKGSKFFTLGAHGHLFFFLFTFVPEGLVTHCGMEGG